MNAASLLRQLLLPIFFLLAGSAYAHSDQVTTGGFVAGYLHPLTGFDHLLAMVAVGIWGATLGAPLLWLLPVVFPFMMVVGGVLGIFNVPLPYVELGIAASVCVMGSVIALQWRAPVWAALLLVGVFGILHGHAHGTELPGSASPAAYAAGFVVSTGMLHLVGIALGHVLHIKHGALLVRGMGAVIALIGAWLLFGV